MDENFSESCLWVSIELIFSDLGGNFEDLAPEVIESYGAFKTVSTMVYKINRIVNGVCEYYPVTFDENHFCFVNMLMYISLVDFRYRDRAVTDKKQDDKNLYNYFFNTRGGIK